MEEILYFHPGSDSYFYAVPGIYDGGLAEDVDGIQFHEIQAKKKGVNKMAFNRDKKGVERPDSIKRQMQYQPRMQLIRFIEQFEVFLAYDPANLVKSCLSCDHFNEQTEICKLVNKRPPAKVIAFACEKYDNIDDDIPF